MVAVGSVVVVAQIGFPPAPHDVSIAPVVPALVIVSAPVLVTGALVCTRGLDFSTRIGWILSPDMRTGAGVK